ncbi:MAG: redoxin domain-containing protein [Propionibacteriales bacterium]|nr:redoxin domain-containing protein [Propionibacteriales bacterium]
MTAIRLVRRLRPVVWVVSAIGLVAIIAWQAGAFGSASSDAKQGAIASGANVKPGLDIYAVNERSEMPELTGTTLDGDPFTLSNLAGNIVVINVWGSWCGPCRAETPDLVRLSRKFDDQQVRFVGIDTRDNLSSATAFVGKFKVPYPSIFDDDGRALLPLRHIIPSAVIPSTVVVDPQGKVAARIIGPVTYNTLNGLLEDELAGGNR